MQCFQQAYNLEINFPKPEKKTNFIFDLQEKKKEKKKEREKKRGNFDIFMQLFREKSNKIGKEKKMMLVVLLGAARRFAWKTSAGI